MGKDAKRAAAAVAAAAAREAFVPSAVRGACPRPVRTGAERCPAEAAKPLSVAVLAGAAGAVVGKKRVKRQSTSTVLEKAATDALDPAKLLERYVMDRGGSRVLRKLLIANNGMAATKAILSLRQWSYLELGSDSVFEFVVMATLEDLEANAEFIRLANTYVEVPGGKNVNNYANVDLIVDIAKSQGIGFATV